MRTRAALFLILIYCTLSACSGNNTKNPEAPVIEKPPVPTRSYALGFTDFPHANSTEAYEEAWDVLAGDADMVTMHFDGGVPWQEALDGSDYPTSFLSEIVWKGITIALELTDHVKYLAVTPISLMRDTLALYRGSDVNMPLPAPWDSYNFDHPDVIEAYINHCETMIYHFDPHYFAYAIEANVLQFNKPGSWDAFVTLAEAVYTSVKALHPDLPVFVTLHAGIYHQYIETQETAVERILPYTDFIALSCYPYTMDPDPANLDADFFFDMAALAPGKPFAIAETAWPAEDITTPYPEYLPASETMQNEYMNRLFADLDSLDARFVNWFFARDYDDFWDTDFQHQEDAWIARMWKDTGLYDGDGAPRPAYYTWRDKLGMLLE